MINLETPRKFRPFVKQAHQVAEEFLRANSRKYDLAEHAYPKELDLLASLVDGMGDSGHGQGAGAAGVRRDEETAASTKVKNGTNMSSVLSIIEMCWADVGLLLSMPRQGLGNSAIASVANAEQLERFKGTWASMAITEPSFGSDSAAITTTAVKDGDAYILNGEKIFVTAGERSDSVVVWATLDKSLGRGGDQVVPRHQGPARHPGRAPRAQAGHPFVRHRGHRPGQLPGPGGEPAGQPRDLARGSPARWRRSTTRVRWWPAWRWVVPVPRSRTSADCWRRPASTSTTTARHSRSRTRRRRSSRWRPIGKPRCC